MLTTSTQAYTSQTGWNQRLMIKTSETSPHYLMTNQSEDSPTPASFTPDFAYKNSSIKAMREFESLQHELPVLPA